MLKDRNIFKLGFITLILVSYLYSNAQNTFIENKGQFPKQVKAKANLPSGSLFFEEGKLIYTFYSKTHLASRHDLDLPKKEIDAHTYVAEFLNYSQEVSTKLLDESKYYENYFLRNESEWATRVKSYKTLYHKNIYKDIDIKFYTLNDKLKYDIIIAPYAFSDQIKIKYTGVNNLELSDGNICFKTSVNRIVEHKPYAYQIINGTKNEVACIYELKNNILSFVFPQGYNKDYTLIIDPVLDFSTYSGSTADNFGYTATYDNFGFLYAGSTSFGVGYPTTIGAYQINYANSLGGTDIAITKYDTTGTFRIYSTYLGGGFDELPHSMIVNSSNELFIYGSTASADFPTTASAFQQNFIGGQGFSPSGIGVSFPNGSDIFVSRLSASGGNLLASTFIGGSGNDGINTATQLKYNYADEVRGEIDIDKQNNIYIATCTQSIDFPITNSFQNSSSGGQEGIIIKMDNQLSSIIWSSYLGGSADDAIYSLAIDNNDNIYVTGGTNSTNFPTITGSYQSTYQDSIKADAFVTKISSDGAHLLASSYFGTNYYDQSYFVEIGSADAIYLFGQTKSIGSQLVNNATYSVAGGGQFISVFNKDLTVLLRSTVFGTGKGTPDISPTAFLVDVCDKIYIAGWGSNLGGPLSTLNLPVTYDAHQSTTDGNDIYLMVLDDSLSEIIYATYYGGSQSNEHVDGGTSRFDKKGIIYQSVCAGCGGNSDFPIEPNPGAVSTTNNSLNCNNGVFKFDFDFPMVIADFDAPWVGCDTVISFQNLTNSSSLATYFWDFGDGTTSNNKHPTHNYNESGSYSVTLVATDNNACNLVDTIVREVFILSNSLDTVIELVKCPEDQIQIGLLPVNDPSITYFWAPSTTLSSPNVSNPFSYTNISQEYQLLISNGNCTDTLIQEVLVPILELDVGPDTSYCNTPILLKANISNNINDIQWSSSFNFIDTLSNTTDLTVDGVGKFYIRVSDGLCEQFDSVEVYPESISVEMYSNDICLGDTVFVGVINLNPAVELISYNWNINNLSVPEITDSPDFGTWYSVQVVNKQGCVVEDSVFVQVYENPTIDTAWISDTIIFKGEDVSLNVSTRDNIFWNDFLNSNSTQIIFPNQTKCFQYQVNNTFGCNIKDSLCVVVKDVFCDTKNIKIPTAFSPNQDNINDTYIIEDRDGIVTDFKLEIFNRLGQKVFFSRNIFTHWDGTFRGNMLSPQVFDFYLELECVGEKELFHKGNITLIR